MSHQSATEVPRLFAAGHVENPRDTYGYRSGFRLASSDNPSALFNTLNSLDTTLTQFQQRPCDDAFDDRHLGWLGEMVIEAGGHGTTAIVVAAPAGECDQCDAPQVW